MKKVLAILLIFSFLSANTELHQLYKLPVLIHHFFEHKNQNHNESLSSFLLEHYTSDKPSHCNNANKDHKNLPFKTHDCETVHSTTFLNTQSTLSFCAILLCSKITFQNKMKFVQSAFLSNIWQPPKIV
ncbi:MAG: hypothetical protein HUU47_01585 [Bacteroidetes bacterium]|nr:hypothetical protein [Bacteroidota bacterium]